MILGCVQPAYLAWIPFFKRMQISDIFVYLDDVEYSKNSFHNRNRIKSSAGELLLTVPILYKGNSSKTIAEIPINDNVNWAKKHWHAIEMNYCKTKYFKELAPTLHALYLKDWATLAELNINLLEVFRVYLGITTPTYISSELKLEGQANEKLVNMCKALGADSFVVKPGTEHYHPAEYFLKSGIKFEYFNYMAQPYKQMYGDFIPGLSILDYAMNCGPNSL